MNLRFTMTASIAALSASMLSMHTASAQSNGNAEAASNGGGDQIVVTALRREQNIQDVPAALSAYSSGDLEKLQVIQIADVVKFTPNVQVNYPFGDGGPPNFVIRAISSTDYSPNQSKPIAIYLDEGVRNLQVLETVPIFDVERVEVLRGPQGTLYGKNATGGAVNIISKKPGFEPEGYAKFGYGNFNTIRAQAAAQTSLIDDVLAARIAMTYTKDDGKIRNLTPGLDDTSQTDIFAVRASLYFEPSDMFDATLRFTHTDSGGRNYTALPTDIDLSIFPNLAAIPGTDRAGLSFFESQPNRAPERKIKSDGFNLLMHWKPSEGYTITSVTTYDQAEWRDDTDADGLPIELDDPIITATDGVRAFTQELRIASDLDGPFNWQAGAFYSFDKSDAAFEYGFFIDPRCGADCDLGFGGGGLGIFQINSFHQERNSYALFARGEFDLTPDLTVFAGVRQSWDDLEVSDYNGFFGDSGNPFENQGITDFSDSRDFKNTSFEGGVNWTPTENMLLYASYRQGYRTGAVNAQAFFDPSEVTFAPQEEADSIEVGAKATFADGAVVLNAAGFRTKYDNQQVVVSEGGLFPLRSISEARVLGFEADATIRPTERVVLKAGIGVLDPVYGDGVFTSGVDISNNQMINASKFNANVSGDFVLYEAGDRSLDLHVNGIYTGDVFYDVFEGQGQEGYWIANAQLAYNAENFVVSFGVRNLFNEEYLTYSLDLVSAGLGFNYNTRGMPRTYGGDITVRF